MDNESAASSSPSFIPIDGRFSRQQAPPHQYGFEQISPESINQTGQVSDQTTRWSQPPSDLAMLAHAADIADTDASSTSWGDLSGDNMSSGVLHTPHPVLDRIPVVANRQAGKQTPDLNSIVSIVMSRLQAADKSSMDHAETPGAQSSSARFESNTSKTSARSNAEQERSSIQMTMGGPGIPSSLNQEELVKRIVAVVAEVTGSLGSDTDDPNARICRVCNKRLKRTCDMK
jgi:hypothetical protein